MNKKDDKELVQGVFPWMNEDTPMTAKTEKQPRNTPSSQEQAIAKGVASPLNRSPQSAVADRVIDFVLWDERFRQMGLHGGAVIAWRESYGREPTEQEVGQVLREFPQAWHERFDHPPPRPSVGGGTPYYTREEMSSWQENSIRAWEEEKDDEGGALIS